MEIIVDCCNNIDFGGDAIFFSSTYKLPTLNSNMVNVSNILITFYFRTAVGCE